MAKIIHSTVFSLPMKDETFDSCFSKHGHKKIQKDKRK
jgi:hypothetical protein